MAAMAAAAATAVRATLSPACLVPIAECTIFYFYLPKEQAALCVRLHPRARASATREGAFQVDDAEVRAVRSTCRRRQRLSNGDDGDISSGSGECGGGGGGSSGDALSNWTSATVGHRRVVLVAKVYARQF